MGIILSILICKRRIFQVSLELYALNFCHLLYVNKEFFVSNMWHNKAVWGNWTPTHKGLTHCSIKCNLHKNRTLILHVHHGKKISNFIRPKMGVSWRFTLSQKIGIMEAKGNSFVLTLSKFKLKQPLETIN